MNKDKVINLSGKEVDYHWVPSCNVPLYEKDGYILLGKTRVITGLDASYTEVNEVFQLMRKEK